MLPPPITFDVLDQNGLLVASGLAQGDLLSVVNRRKQAHAEQCDSNNDVCKEAHGACYKSFRLTALRKLGSRTESQQVYSLAAPTKPDRCIEYACLNTWSKQASTVKQTELTSFASEQRKYHNALCRSDDPCRPARDACDDRCRAASRACNGRCDTALNACGKSCYAITSRDQRNACFDRCNTEHRACDVPCNNEDEACYQSCIDTSGACLKPCIDDYYACYTPCFAPFNACEEACDTAYDECRIACTSSPCRDRCRLTRELCMVPCDAALSECHAPCRTAYDECAIPKCRQFFRLECEAPNRPKQVFTIQ